MKRMLLTALLCLPTAPLLAGEQSAAPAQVEFKFQFEPGRVVRQRMVSTSVGGIRLPDPIPEQKFSQTFEQVLTSRCRSVNPDKSAVLEVSMDDIAMKMTIAGMTLDYDSKKPTPEDPKNPISRLMPRLFNAMSQIRFTVTMSDTGQPLKVEGLSEGLQRAMKSMDDSGDTPGSMKTLLEQMSTMFDDESMKQQMQSCHRMLPPRSGSVRVGEKWENTWTMKMPMFTSMLEGKGDYQLASVEEFRGRMCAKIRLKQTFRTLPPQADKAPAGPAKSILDRMDMELSSSGGDGIAYVDIRTGDLVQLRQSSNLTLSFSLKADPGATNPAERQGVRKMTQKIRNIVSMDLLEEKPGATKPAEVSAGG